jgi:hypothetical protein
MASTQVCAVHPAAAAGFRCDGCGRLLCAGCVEKGHRLLFCRLCRERALPLDPRLPATTTSLHRALTRLQPFRWSAAFGYPFQGSGIFWMYFGLLVVLEIAGSFPVFALAAVMVRLLVACLIPGVLFAIILRSAEGDNDLPDWPDYSDMGERFREVLMFLGTCFVVLLPAILATVLCANQFGVLFGGSPMTLCLLLGAAGLLLGLLVAVPMIGSLALYEHLDLFFRLDLHLRALRVAGAEGLGIIGLFFGVLILSRVLAAILGSQPLLGGALSGAMAAYGSFVGAHLVGWLFLRNRDAFDAIYLP